ncbi:MAG: hypothetical protein JNL58_17340 [Planctomyces sp.]|nr:hypothetical protein [Planctomyces sp.]
MRGLNCSAMGLIAAACLWLNASSAIAQGLLFNLPEDGTAVEYEGTLRYLTGDQDPQPLEWTSELSIKSVGQEQAEYQGVMQACRWIEIKVVTGKSEAAGIDPGPVGARLYKILVPESRIMATATDTDTIPNHMIPIVKGYRRLGEEAVREIKSPALRIYPTITLLTNYDQPELVASGQVPEVLDTALSLTADHMKGKLVMESPESRSTNEANYWVSSEVPFGLARWQVTVVREEKEPTSPRAEFRQVSIETVDMKLRKIRQNAESELSTP